MDRKATSQGNTGGRHSVEKGLSQAPAIWNDLCCLPADGPMGRMSLGSGRHGLEECDFPCVLECSLHLSEPLLTRLLKNTQVENGRGGEESSKSGERSKGKSRNVPGRERPDS